MKKECAHQYDHPHPSFVICIRCKKTIPVLRDHPINQEEFKKLVPSLNSPINSLSQDKLNPGES